MAASRSKRAAQAQAAPTKPARSWRAHAVGAFIAYHLAAVTLKAIPTPEAGMVRASWHDPTVRVEFEAWLERAHAVGFKHLTYDEFEDFLWNLAVHYCDWRNKVLRPFDAYYTYFGTFQSWQMFIAPQRFPTRFSAEVEENGEWRTVFREDDPKHTWLAAELGDTRFRSVLFRLVWVGYHGELEQFTDWVASRAARDFPQATRARVKLLHYRTPSPEEMLANASVEGNVEVLERDLRSWR